EAVPGPRAPRPPRIFRRPSPRADQIAAAVEMQHHIAARGIRSCYAPGLDVAEFILDGTDALRQREIGGEEAVISLAQAVMAARDVFGPEGIFPEIEGALAFDPL